MDKATYQDYLVEVFKLKKGKKLINYINNKVSTELISIFQGVYKNKGDFSERTDGYLIEKLKAKHINLSIEELKEQQKFIIDKTRAFLIHQAVTSTNNKLRPKGQSILIEVIKSNPQLLDSELKTFSKQLSKEQSRTDLSYYHQYQISYTRFFYSQTPQFKSKQGLLFAANENLDMAYLIPKLRLIVENKHRQLLDQEEILIENTEGIFKLADHYRNNTEINAYILLYKILQKRPDYEKFKDVYQFCESNFNKFNPEIQQYLFSKLRNVAYRGFEFGNTRFRDLLIDIMDFEVDNELLLQNGIIRSSHYLQGIILYFSEKRFSQGSEFAKEYRDKLSEKEKKECLILAEVIKTYYHDRGCIHSDLHYSINRVDKSWHIQARTMLCILSYEKYKSNLDEVDLLAFRKEVENLNNYIQNKFKDFARQRFRNFTSLMNFLANHLDSILYTKNSTLVEKFGKHLATEEPIFSRLWFQQEYKLIRESVGV